MQKMQVALLVNAVHSTNTMQTHKQIGVQVK